MNQHLSPEASSATASIEISDESLRSMVPKIYLDRRQQFVDRTWSVVMGMPMNKLAVHVMLTQQLWIRLGVLMKLPRADIGEGCLMLANHDKIETVLVDKNIYNADLITMDEPAALKLMEGGQVTYPLIEEVLHDYENGKKGYGADPRLVRIAKGCKDSDTMETIVEQIEKAATVYNPMRFEDPRVQAECDHKRKCYNFDESRRLHDAIMAYRYQAVHDAFLDLPNRIKDGTHGNYKPLHE